MNIPQGLSDSHTYLYADNTSIYYQHKKFTKIKNVLNKEFANACEWFLDTKLWIHFGKDKTKYFLNSVRNKYLPKLNITYDNNRIKQFYLVEYLDCYLDAN